jgi:hypothetical protein
MSTAHPERLQYEEAVELLFPNRHAVLGRWADQLRPHIDTTIVVDNVTTRDVGWITELCIGFDLTDTVPYLDALTLLDPIENTELLAAAGFAPLHGDGLRTGLIDPASWHRPVRRPMDLSIVMPGSAQIAQLYKLLHDLPMDRALCQQFLNGCHRTPLAAAVHDDATDLWNLYTTRGRDQILALASGPVTARPVFHKDAVGDLIIGPVLFDIKAVTNPLNDLAPFATSPSSVPCSPSTTSNSPSAASSTSTRRPRTRQPDPLQATATEQHVPDYGLTATTQPTPLTAVDHTATTLHLDTEKHAALRFLTVDQRPIGACAAKTSPCGCTPNTTHPATSPPPTGAAPSSSVRQPSGSGPFPAPARRRPAPSRRRRHEAVDQQAPEPEPLLAGSLQAHCSVLASAPRLERRPAGDSSSHRSFGQAQHPLASRTLPGRPGRPIPAPNPGSSRRRRVHPRPANQPTSPAV